MNRGGGKFGQALCDIVHVIIDLQNYEELIEYYRKGQVLFHELLANGKQYLAEIQKADFQESIFHLTYMRLFCRIADIM
jgi:hypothetical protein